MVREAETSAIHSSICHSHPHEPGRVNPSGVQRRDEGLGRGHVLAASHAPCRVHPPGGEGQGLNKQGGVDLKNGSWLMFGGLKLWFYAFLVGGSKKQVLAAMWGRKELQSLSPPKAWLRLPHLEIASKSAFPEMAVAQKPVHTPTPRVCIFSQTIAGVPTKQSGELSKWLWSLGASLQFKTPQEQILVTHPKSKWSPLKRPPKRARKDLRSTPPVARAPKKTHPRFEAFPKTSAGKIDRAALPDAVEAFQEVAVVKSNGSISVGRYTTHNVDPRLTNPSH